MNMIKKEVMLQGIKILPVSMDEALNITIEHINKNGKGYFCFLNIHLCMEGIKNEKVRSALNNSLANFVDGMGIKIALRIFGHKFQGRVRGADFMLRLCEYANKNGLKIFLYGNTEDTLISLNQILKSKFPDIKIAGYYAPPFRELSENENREIVERINSTNPDIVFVSLGAPKQELWMLRNKDKVVGTMFGVGAAFDFITSKIKPAPTWMQNFGLEWLHRLFQQPRKIIYRMFLSPEFFLRVFIQYVLKILRFK